MAGKPAEPPASGRTSESHGGGGRESHGERDGQGDEHIGPLAIERHVKDDGRSLILYWEGPPRA